MKTKFFCILLAICLASCAAKPTFESSLEPNEVAIYTQLMDSVKPYQDLPINELVIVIAKQLLGTPYVASTLEQEPEQLHVYLCKTDCILFVELCSAMAYTTKDIMLTPDGCRKLKNYSEQPGGLLCHNIRQMRYRQGIVDGYASRVHYTSEWIQQNEARGIMSEISRDLGVEYDEPFFFMSSHPHIYKQLEHDSLGLQQIADTEKRLTQAKPYFYVPQTMLFQPQTISQIQSGDIVTFVSVTDGLDLDHVSLAYEFEGEMHFIHASSRAMEVIVEPRTLAEYAKNGIRVIRLLNPTEN